MEVFILNIKDRIKELMKLQEKGKPGYACGWTDACGLILSMIEEEEKKEEKANEN